MDLTLGTSPLLLVLCLLAAAGLTWWTYGRSVPRVPNSRRLLLSALRGAALFIVLVLLFEPVLRRIEATEEPPVLAVLVDASQSLGREDGDGGAAAARDALWIAGKVVAFASVARRATRHQEQARQMTRHLTLVREVHEQVIQRMFGVGLVLASDAPLEGEAERRDDSPRFDRATPRNAGSRAGPTPFFDDFQARLAHQTLRAIALDRAQRSE